MSLLLCAVLLILTVPTRADTPADYIPSRWRERAQQELSGSHHQRDFRGAGLDDGIAGLTLGPFETLDFIGSDETDPRNRARLSSAKFEIIRGDTCVGTVLLRETRPPAGESPEIDATLLEMFDGPEPRRYDPLDVARARARTPGSVCELILPLQPRVWRTILIDTEDGEHS